MGITLLDLVETALRVAKQALEKRAGKPDSGGLAPRSTHGRVLYSKKKAIVTLNSSIGSVSCWECVTDLRSARMLYPI
jgi:hypothetical protein